MQEFFNLCQTMINIYNLIYIIIIIVCSGERTEDRRENESSGEAEDGRDGGISN